MKKRISYILIASFSWGILSFCVPTQVSASAITETNIFNLTNQERSTYNVAGLSWNYKLANAARAKAQDMINNDYFSHNSPDGRTPWSFILAAGYNYVYAGENLAMNFTVAEDVMNAWMNSGGHRANILGSKFRELGVGVVTGEYQGYTTTMIVQMFGTEATSYNKPPSQSNPPAKNTPSQSPAPQPAIDYSQTINLSSGLIKKRIEDFKNAYNSLMTIVTKKEPVP